MEILIQVSLAVICIFIIWRIYKTIQNNPDVFSKENISKSFFTMGVLGLILVGGIAVLVLLLRS